MAVGDVVDGLDREDHGAKVRALDDDDLAAARVGVVAALARDGDERGRAVGEALAGGFRATYLGAALLLALAAVLAWRVPMRRI